MLITWSVSYHRIFCKQPGHAYKCMVGMQWSHFADYSWVLLQCGPNVIRHTVLYWLSQNINQSLSHWGRVTYISIGKLTIIGSYDGLSTGQHQAIIWTYARILFIGALGTYFSEILSEIHTFANVVCKMAAILSQPQCVKITKYNP